MASLEMQQLARQIDDFKNASMFDAKDKGKAALTTLLKVLNDLEGRLQKVEQPFKGGVL